jgi:hypothetical protein
MACPIYVHWGKFEDKSCDEARLTRRPVIIIIIIIIIIILVIFFIQGTYSYIPETNHVPREHRVATILM